MQMPEIPENVKENKNVLFIGILYLCILGLWILSVPIISSSISIIILLSILQFYSLFSIYAKEKNTQENFYFETSPNIGDYYQKKYHSQSLIGGQVQINLDLLLYQSRGELQ